MFLRQSWILIYLSKLANSIPALSVVSRPKRDHILGFDRHMHRIENLCVMGLPPPQKKIIKGIIGIEDIRNYRPAFGAALRLPTIHELFKGPIKYCPVTGPKQAIGRCLSGTRDFGPSVYESNAQIYSKPSSSVTCQIHIAVSSKKNTDCGPPHHWLPIMEVSCLVSCIRAYTMGWRQPSLTLAT
jgi:hypothetical protein